LKSYREFGLDFGEGISSLAVRDLEVCVVGGLENGSSLEDPVISASGHGNGRNGQRKDDSSLGEVHLGIGLVLSGCGEKRVDGASSRRIMNVLKDWEEQRSCCLGRRTKDD
jgi:hypothetical protein